VLVTLLRASLQFFLRFFPETDTIDVQDYLHIDVGVGYEQGSTNMYLSPLVALLEGSPSWFTKWFPIHPKSKQDVEDARLALENFMSSPVNPMAIFRESYAVWDSIAGIMDDLVKRCSQHSSWSSFLAEGLKGSGGGLRAMFPWLPCFARGQRDASLVGTRLSLCARTIFQEQPAYTDDTDGSPTPLLDASLGSDGLRDTKATWDRVLVCNEMLYTMCFSMADIEDEDAQK
jgi:hypothetical protein